MPGTVTLVGLSGHQRGVAQDEQGINIESIETVTRPEFKDYLLDRTGHKQGFGAGDPEQEITVKGEIKGAAGLPVATFYVAVALANSLNYYGAAGGVYLDEATITEEREGWKKGSWKLSRNKNIA